MATTEPRDPRIDPRPGDVLSKGSNAIMVHWVHGDTVYLGGYEPETQRSPLGGWQVPLAVWRQVAQQADSVHAIDIEEGGKE